MPHDRVDVVMHSRQIWRRTQIDGATTISDADPKLREGYDALEIMIRTPDGVTQNIVVEANAIERPRIMTDRLPIYQGIKPNRDIIAFVIDGPYTEVIVNLFKLEVGERIERKRSGRRKSGMLLAAHEK